VGFFLLEKGWAHRISRSSCSNRVRADVHRMVKKDTEETVFPASEDSSFIILALSPGPRCDLRRPENHHFWTW